MLSVGLIKLYRVQVRLRIPEHRCRYQVIAELFPHRIVLSSLRPWQVRYSSVPTFSTPTKVWNFKIFSWTTIRNLGRNILSSSEEYRSLDKAEKQSGLSLSSIRRTYWTLRRHDSLTCNSSVWSAILKTANSWYMSSPIDIDIYFGKNTGIIT